MGDPHLQLFFRSVGFETCVLEQSRGPAGVPAYTQRVPFRSEGAPAPFKLGRMQCVSKERLDPRSPIVVARFECTNKDFRAVFSQSWGSAVTEVDIVTFIGGKKELLRSYDWSEMVLTRQWPGFHACMRDQRVFFDLTIHEMGWEVRKALVLFHINELPGALVAEPETGTVTFATHWGHVTPTKYWGHLGYSPQGDLLKVEHVPDLDDQAEDVGQCPSSGIISFAGICCAYEKPVGQTSVQVNVVRLRPLLQMHEGQPKDFGKRQQQVEYGIFIDFAAKKVQLK